MNPIALSIALRARPVWAVGEGGGVALGGIGWIAVRKIGHGGHPGVYLASDKYEARCSPRGREPGLLERPTFTWDAFRCSRSPVQANSVGSCTWGVPNRALPALLVGYLVSCERPTFHRDAAMDGQCGDRSVDAGSADVARLPEGRLDRVADRGRCQRVADLSSVRASANTTPPTVPLARTRVRRCRPVDLRPELQDDLVPALAVDVVSLGRDTWRRPPREGPSSAPPPG